MREYEFERVLLLTIRRRVRDYVASGGHISGLAAKTDLGTATISRIAYGETLWPRLHTCIALADALGIFLAVDAGEPAARSVAQAARPAAGLH